MSSGDQQPRSVDKAWGQALPSVPTASAIIVLMLASLACHLQSTFLCKLFSLPGSVQSWHETQGEGQQLSTQYNCSVYKLERAFYCLLYPLYLHIQLPQLNDSLWVGMCYYVLLSTSVKPDIFLNILWILYQNVGVSLVVSVISLGVTKMFLDFKEPLVGRYSKGGATDSNISPSVLGWNAEECWLCWQDCCQVLASLHTRQLADDREVPSLSHKLDNTGHHQTHRLCLPG